MGIKPKLTEKDIKKILRKLGGGENEWYFKWKLFKTK